MSKPSVDSLFGAPPESNGAAPDLTDKDIKKLSAKYLQLAAESADLAERKKEADQRRDHAELLLLDAMKALGAKSWRSEETGQLFTSTVKHRFQLPPKSEPEARKKVLAWLKRVGARDLVAEDVNTQSVTAFLRERLEAGRDVNPLIKDTEFRYLSVRKE